MAMPGPQPFRIDQSTAPPSVMAQQGARTDVTAIVASDVARQICIRSGVLYPSRSKAKKKVGTRMIPPPTPKKTPR